MPHSTSKTIRIAPLRLPHAGLIRLCEVASASLDRLPESESAPRHLYTHIDIELTHRSEGARREYASAAELLADTATVAALLRRGAIWRFFAHGRHGHIALESRTLALLEARTVERISGPSLEWVASTADALRAAARTSAAFALCLVLPFAALEALGIAQIPEDSPAGFLALFALIPLLARIVLSLRSQNAARLMLAGAASNVHDIARQRRAARPQ